MKRSARSNLSWQQLGRKLRFQSLWPTLQKVVKAARQRRLKWEAFRLIEADKYGNRKPIGQWMWIPKTRVIVEVVRGHFIGAGGRPVGRVVNGTREIIHRERVHPLARTAKEAFDAVKWGDWRRGKRRRWGGTRMTPGPQYTDWLEAREWAQREGRKIAPFDKWRSDISERWHWEWYRSSVQRGHPAAGTRYAAPYSNPKRRARRPRRGLTTSQMLQAVKAKGGDSLNVSLVVAGGAFRGSHLFSYEGRDRYYHLSLVDDTDETVSAKTIKRRYPFGDWTIDPTQNPRRPKKHLSRWDPKSWPRKGRGGASPVPIDSRYWLYVYNSNTGKGDRVAWSTNLRVAMSALRKLQREHGKMGAWIFDRASKQKITHPW